MGQGSTNEKLQCQISSWISMEQLQSQHQPLAYYRTSCWKPAVLLPLGIPACITKMCAASRIAEYNSGGKWYQDAGVQLSKASLEHLQFVLLPKLKSMSMCSQQLSTSTIQAGAHSSPCCTPVRDSRIPPPPSVCSLRVRLHSGTQRLTFAQ